MPRESKCWQDYESNEVAEESVALIMQEESMAFSKQKRTGEQDGRTDCKSRIF